MFVPFIALVETIWVLRESYGFTKTQMLEVFRKLLENERYEIANGKVFGDALTNFLSVNVDFADCAIHAEARRADTDGYRSSHFRSQASAPRQRRVAASVKQVRDKAALAT